MKYFESGKINVYPAGFRDDAYKQSKLTTEENITHLQNFMSTSDGLYIDYIDYSKNHTSAHPSIVQITNANAGAYFYTVIPEGKTEAEAMVYINSDNQISVNNDYFILRVCGYSFRFKIIDFLNLCLASPSLSGNDVYGYIYLRTTGPGPIGYVLGNVHTPSTNVLDQGDLFQGLGIGSGSESGYKVKIGKFDLVDSVNRFTISYDPIQIVNATSDEDGNNIKTTYAHSLSKTPAANPNTNGDILSLKNNLDEDLPESTLSTFEIVNAKHAASSKRLDDKPSLKTSTSDNLKITVTAGGQTSDAFLVPYASVAAYDQHGNNIKATYAHSLTTTNADYTTDTKFDLKNSNEATLSSVEIDRIRTANRSVAKNGTFQITKSSDVDNYNYYIADFYGFELSPGAFLTVYLEAGNGSDKGVKFKLNLSEDDSQEAKVVYLNGNPCSSANKLSNSNTFYNAYYTGTYWNFTPANKKLISGTSVTLNGTDRQGDYINIYAPASAGTSTYILQSNGSNLNGSVAPTWTSQASLFVGRAAKAVQDEDGANIKANYGSSLSVSDATITLNNKNGKELNSVTVNNVQNSSYASKIGTSSDYPQIGDVNNPVYVADDGTVTAGKYIPKLNGSDQDTTTSFYAPTSAGTSGDILKSTGSTGSGAPTWIAQEELTVGSAAKIYVTDKSGVGKSGYKSIQSVTALPTSPAADTLYIVVEA